MADAVGNSELASDRSHSKLSTTRDSSCDLQAVTLETAKDSSLVPRAVSVVSFRMKTQVELSKK